ncbi:MAG: sugar MFS transporter, partial [Armatimonadota bacterium]
MTDSQAPNGDLEGASNVAYARLMAASAVGMIAFGASVAIPSVCLEAIGREFGLNFEQRGLLTTARMGALLASLLTVGYLGDRLGKRHFLFWGGVLIAAGQAATARAARYGALLGGNAVSGLGKGVMEALVNPLVAQLNPHRSARVLNIINGLFSVGLVLAALTTGEVLQAGKSWRVSFWLWVPPALVCAGLYVTRRYPAIGAAQREAGHPRRFLRDPLFWPLLVGMALGGGCEAGLTSWGPNFVEHELGASARSGAWAMVLFGTFMAAGRFTGSGLVARLTPPRMMMASAAACGLTTVGLCFVEDLWGAWALFALGGLFVACFWPTILAVASDNIATGSAALFAALAAGGIGGCVVFPWAIGALGDAFGLRGGIILLPASMVVQVVVLAAASRMIARR